jgi:hypothetical protein
MFQSLKIIIMRCSTHEEVLYGYKGQLHTNSNPTELIRVTKKVKAFELFETILKLQLLTYLCVELRPS